MPDTPSSAYQQRLEQYTREVSRLNRRHRVLGAFRLLIAVLFFILLYGYLQKSQLWLLGGMGVLFIAFFFVIRIHQQLGERRKMAKTLGEINETELNFPDAEDYPFEDGAEFMDPHHAYASDLDIFGRRSLFQYLNRTDTHAGKLSLAKLLSGVLSPTDIIANQQAISELSGMIDWRQQFNARARLSGDSPKVYHQLLGWAGSRQTHIRQRSRVFSFALPVLLLIALALYLFTNVPFTGNIAFLLFILNLYLSNTAQKKAAVELIHADKIDALIKAYGLLLADIETKDFKTVRLQKLQRQLGQGTGTASVQLRKLSFLFSRMEHVQNLIGGFVLNGMFQYHIHTLVRLVAWKKENALSLVVWMEAIGELEALSSLANFSFNNPDYVFPVLNDHYEVTFKALGHPLIPRQKRVCNSIKFQPQRFIILTGSNMSGKSTFLRTLGVTMVLAGAGAPVCASSASVHPLPVLVSMGQRDSLADNESYFFAEVKRLKYIMDTLEQETCFVLLDEILRGTNSDDKRNGTIGVIEKIIRQNTIGAIATHDLEVCHTTYQYPEVLSNKCFEVVIDNNELAFDYQLRPGICHNQSATFLMKKMNIIP